jgi:hypothetical protein
MMSEASDVFDDMLTIPQPPGSITRVVALAENSEALRLLLTWIYPQYQRPNTTSFFKLAPLLVVAKKYEVVVNILHAMLVLPAILKANPFEIYVFCVRHDFELEGRCALCEIVRQDIDSSQPAPSRQFEDDCHHISFGHIRRVDSFRKMTRHDIVQRLRRSFGAVEVRQSDDTTQTVIEAAMVTVFADDGGLFGDSEDARAVLQISRSLTRELVAVAGQCTYRPLVTIIMPLTKPFQHSNGPKLELLTNEGNCILSMLFPLDRRSAFQICGHTDIGETTSGIFLLQPRQWPIELTKHAFYPFPT